MGMGQMIMLTCIPFHGISWQRDLVLRWNILHCIRRARWWLHPAGRLSELNDTMGAAMDTVDLKQSGV